MAGTRPYPSPRVPYIRARAFDNGEWSPITETQFILAPIADASNIVVSEIMYNPAGSSEETEWVELMNVSGDTIDLTGLHFTGIDYTFPLGVTLAPGARTIIVRDQAAFSSAYDTAGIQIAPGDFSPLASTTPGRSSR